MGKQNKYYKIIEIFEKYGLRNLCRGYDCKKEGTYCFE